MKINTNNWNIIRYTIYTPFYDIIAAILKKSRRKSIEMLNIQSDDKVLIVGAGTGLDLEFIHSKCDITAIDITPAMVNIIKRRSKRLNRDVNALVMDGHKLLFPDESFDCVILHLILAIIPDPIACFTEAERVLKTGGHLVIFDKLLSKHQKPSFLRKILNPLTNLLFSSITRSFGSIYRHSNMKVKSDISTFRGLFRIIVLKK